MTRQYRILGPFLVLSAAAALLTSAGSASAQTTTFTYQGRLNEGGQPANGTYDFQFQLFDTVTLGTGTQQGGTLVVPTVPVSGGLFTVPLDFGPGVFGGADRFLEIAVKKPSDSVFTTLDPRQPLTSTPYAVRSLLTTSADALSAACVGCVTSGQVQSVTGGQVTGPIAGSQINGAIPVASVPAGSPSYVQNGTALQTSADFNISGNGTAAILAANTQFNLGAARVLGVAGTNSLAAGVNAGASITTGTASAFFGQNAGQLVTTGSSNEFFGFNAGRNTTTGGNNVFFGDAAGFGNVAGGNNAMFGTLSGINTNGSFNAFFGDRAGASNTAGLSNSFFGNRAGEFTGATSNNSYFGARAGGNSSVGGSNSFFGVNAGLSMTSGTANTLLGASTIVSLNGLDHATAIGADASVGTSNTIVLGRAADLTQVSGLLNVVGSQVNFAGSRMVSNPGTRNVFLGIGTGTANTGTDNVFVGSGAGQANSTGTANAFLGANAGLSNTAGAQNAFYGVNAGRSNTTGNENAFFGTSAGFISNTDKNSFFGTRAGNSNTGIQNSAFGESAGQSMAGSFNSIFGQGAGNNSGSGSENVFMGWFAGGSYGTAFGNTFVGSQTGFTLPVPPSPSGSSNVALGRLANVTSGLFNATAIGAGAQVTQSSSLVLGNSTVRVGIGTTAPQARLHVADTNSNTFLGQSGCGGGGIYGAVGFVSPLNCQNYSLVGGDGSTYINRSPGGSIYLQQGNFAEVIINPTGTVTLLALGTAGVNHLCRNAGNEISSCSSSLRYKTDVTSFRGGMDLVRRLRPIAFNWRGNGTPDLGLGAEEVAKVESRLVTLDDKGEVEGVKYEHLGVVFINAFNEQQAQIEAQRGQIESQQERLKAQEERLERQERELERLKALVLGPSSSTPGGSSRP